MQEIELYRKAELERIGYMLGWRKYRRKHEKEGVRDIVSASQVERARPVATRYGVEQAKPGDYLVTNERGRLWVLPKWVFEHAYERIVDHGDS